MSWGAILAQWWEHLSPTSVARVQIPASTPYVGWVCCWFSPFFREVFLRVLRFSPLLKNQHFQIPIRPGARRRRTTQWMCYLSNPYLLFISPCKRRCRHCLPIALQLRGRGSAGFCGAVLKPSPLSCNRSQDRVPAMWCYFFFFSLPLYLLFFLLAFSHLFPIPNSFSIFLSLKLGEDGWDACLFS